MQFQLLNVLLMTISIHLAVANGYILDSQLTENWIADPLSDWTNESSLNNAEELGPFVEGDIRVKYGRGLDLSLEGYLWPGGIIPYYISSKFSYEDVARIVDAISNLNFELKDCVKFVPVTPKTSDNFVYIQSENTGCWSSVGRTGGRQELNLQSPQCTSIVGSIIHQLVHVVGLRHEHNRPDRDDHVSIVWPNVIEEKKDDLATYPANLFTFYRTSYDFESVTHYSSYAHSEDPEHSMTIVPKEGQVVGQREKLSYGDQVKIRRLYRCLNALADTDSS